jgi:hypothetical protein
MKKRKPPKKKRPKKKKLEPPTDLKATPVTRSQSAGCRIRKL